jgi:hypothetical protein
MDMSFTTTCWASPVRHILFFGLLAALALLPFSYRRGAVSTGRAASMLAAPLLFFAVSSVAAALSYSYLEGGLWAGGARGPGSIAAGLAEVASVRLYGIYPAVFLAIVTSFLLARAAQPSQPHTSRSAAAVLTVTVCLLTCAALVAFKPIPRPHTFPALLLPSCIALLLALVLVLAGPRLWPGPASRRFALRGAGIILAILVAALLVTAYSREQWLRVAVGGAQPLVAAGSLALAAELDIVGRHKVAMNLKFLRTFWNPVFVVGLAILALGCGPLVLFGVLQEFGYFPENNGLGLGLPFWIAVWPALAFLIGGTVVAVKRADTRTGSGGAA